MERAVILRDGETFVIDESWLAQATPRLSKPAASLTVTMAAQERNVIEAALENSRGRISGASGAARKLGAPRTTLESKIKSLRINKYQFKSC